MIPGGPIPRFPRGRQLLNGDDVDKLSLLVGGSGSTLTAKAGGGKSGATPITSTNARVGTVATAADSVLLPPGYPGLRVFIVNTGANSMQVFGAGTDTINGVATGTGVAQAAGVSALYVCTGKTAAGVGEWYRLLSA